VPEPPAECPSCGTPTVKPEEGVWTICPNRASCPGQLFQALKHFVSRGAMDIDGLGEERVLLFLREGLISNVADIYELSEDRLTALEGFGEVSARNLVVAIEASKERPFSRVLFGLGIQGIGFVNARALTQQFRTVDRLLEASAEEIERTPGIGPILASTIAETLAEERGVRLASVESPTMDRLARTTNKHSSNFYAEMLLKALSAADGDVGTTR